MVPARSDWTVREVTSPIHQESGIRNENEAANDTQCVASWVLGVDLGTSFSAGATLWSGRAEVIEIGGERRIPSTVLLAEDGRLLAGTTAQRMAGRHPDRAERNPKRYVGRGPMLLGGEPVTAAAALSAQLAPFVAEGCRRFDGAAPAVLALTHPVTWSSAQRDVLRSAAGDVLPGVPVVLAPEPIAAATHYAHEHDFDPGALVAVYDLGGRRFDTAVLVRSATDFDIVGRPGGDPDIGGEAFDEQVYAHFGAQLERNDPDWWNQVSTGSDRRSLAATTALRTESRLAKEALSEYTTTGQYILDADYDVTITRAELDELIGHAVIRSAEILAETVASAGLDAADLKAVFLTGAASRMPLVEATLARTYAGRLRTWQDPKSAVALGAARLGQRTVESGTAAASAPAVAPAAARPGPVWHPSEIPGYEDSRQFQAVVSGGRPDSSRRPWQTVWGQGRAAGGDVIGGTDGSAVETALGLDADGRPVALVEADGVASFTPGSYDPVRLPGCTRILAAAADLRPGRTIAVIGREDHSAWTWDVGMAMRIGRPLVGHTDSVTAAAATALDASGVVVTGSADGTVRIWDLDTGAMLVGPITCHAGAVTAVGAARLRNGQLRIVTGGEDHTVRVWDGSSGGAIGHRSSRHEQPVDHIATATLPDGRAVAITGGRRRRRHESGADSQRDVIHVWDMDTAMYVRSLGGDYAHGVERLATAVLADGRPAVVVGGGGMARIWDLTTAETIGAPITATADTWMLAARFALAVVTLPDSRPVAVVCLRDCSVQFVDLGTGDRLDEPRLISDFRQMAGTVSATVLPDGRLLAVTGGHDQSARAWDLGATDAPAAPMPSDLTDLRAMTIGLRGGRRVGVTGHQDGTIQVRDIETGRPLGVPLAAHTKAVTGLAPAQLRDGRDVMVSIGDDETLRVHDLTTSAAVFRPWRTGSQFGAVATAVLPPHGRPIATICWDEGQVWDLTGDDAPRMSGLSPVDEQLWTVATVALPAARTTAVQRPARFSLRRPDVTAPAVPQVVAVTGGGGSTVDAHVRVWDLSTGHPAGDPLIGHRGGVYAVATATLRDGRPIAVSSGGDHTVRVWDLTTRRAIGAPLTGHGGLVRGIAVVVLADGRPVAITGGVDATVRAWDLDTMMPLGYPLQVTGGVYRIAAWAEGSQVGVLVSGDGLLSHIRLDTTAFPPRLPPSPG